MGGTLTPDHQAILDRYRAALAKLEATGPFTIDDGLACIKAAYELRHYVYPHLPANERQALLDELERVKVLVEQRRDVKRDRRPVE